MTTKKKYGYICGTDFYFELGDSPGDVDIYRSVEDLKKNRDCWKECGIYKVCIAVDEIILEGDF